MYAGGTFGRAGTTAANRVARWDGSAWATLGSGIDGVVLDCVQFGGDLVVGGRFRGAGGVLSRGVARWNGSAWSGLGTGLESDAYAVAVLNNQLVAAGPYSGDPNGVLTSRVMRWDGSSWSPLGAGMNGDVDDLIVYNGELVAAGYFTNAGGVAVTNIARWTGSAWAPLGAPSIPQVFAMAIFQDQLVVAGQRFASSGTPAYAVERWNGQEWQSLGTPPNDTIRALAVQGGVLYAGGTLAGIGGNVDSVIRWDGQAWTGLAGLDHNVYTLAIHDGQLVAAGSYADGADVPISRWDGVAWNAMGASVEVGVATLFEHQGTLLASGNFHVVGNLISPFLAAYGPAQTTQTRIVATSPSPSQVGQSVQINVEISALTAPSAGHVTVTASPGGACTDLTLTPINAATALAECTIQWNGACPRQLVANYVGGTDGLTVWQPSEAAPQVHQVVGGPACTQAELFGDSFE